MDKIFWREKGTKAWKEGWIDKIDGLKIKITPYPNAVFGGVWYDRFDIDIEERR